MPVSRVDFDYKYSDPALEKHYACSITNKLTKRYLENN